MIERFTTKDLLIKSVKDLAKCTPFDKITIQSIVDNCSLSKRTFYNNFDDKFDLLAKMCAEDMRKNFDHAKENGTYYDFELVCVKGAVDGSFHNYVKNTSQSSPFIHTVYALTFSLLAEHVSESFENGEMDDKTRFELSFFTHGAIDSIYWEWYIGGMPISAEDLTYKILSSAPLDLRKRLSFKHGYFPEDAAL